MKNQDTLINQFQKAAEQAPLEHVPQHEAIWDKIESRLDQKELTSKKQLWKRIAIAACLLLVGSILFQWWNSTSVPTIQTAPVVTNDTVPTPVVTTSASVDTTTSALHPEAKKILKKQLEATPVVVATTASPQPVAVQDEPSTPFKKMKGMPFKNNVFEARGVTHVNADADGVADVETTQTTTIAPALFVLDDKAITGASKSYQSKTESKINNADDIESITVLPDPLYIINGVEYTEKELFGPHPTSPYFPLNEQNIIDTKILQGTEATTAYGEKGAKGVVIITTQNGKPKTSKKTKKK